MEFPPQNYSQVDTQHKAQPRQYPHPSPPSCNPQWNNPQRIHSLLRRYSEIDLIVTMRGFLDYLDFMMFYSSIKKVIS